MARNKAQIEISAKDKTKKAFSSVTQGLSGVTGKLFNLKSALAGTVGAVGFGAMIKSSLKTQDALGKTADKLGATTEALAGLRHAGELTGVANNKMDMSLQRMTRRLSEVAETGSGPAAKALKEMGLNAEELLKLPLEEQLGAVADGMQNAATQGDKVRLAFALFDSEGVDLVNTLSKGSEGLATMIKEADDLGVTLSRLEVAQIEAANDQFTRLGAQAKGAANQITAALAPALTVAAEEMLGLTAESDFWGETTKNVINSMLTGFGYVKEALNLVDITFLGIKATVQGLGAVWLTVVETIVSGADSIASIIPGIESPLGGIVEGIGIMQSVLTDQFNATTAALIEAQANIGTYGAAVLEIQESIREATLTTADADTSATKTAEANQRKRLLLLNQEAAAAKKAAKDKAAADKLKAKSDQSYLNSANSIGQSMFANNKGVMAGMAVVNTAAGITRAFAELPFPAALAASAAIAASGVAQLASISSASSSGGGSVASSSAAAAAPGFGTVDAPLDINPGGGGGGTSIELTLVGESFTKDQVRGLIEQMNEEIRDGAVLSA
jgi:hypothetical protein